VAIQKAKERLAERSGRINWIEGDITEVALKPAYYDLWHDRAVFHFLIQAEDREAYVRAAEIALKPGGYLILAGFSMIGPKHCSGLDVVRYNQDTLQAELGSQFVLLRSVEEPHLTPTGVRQEFLYCLFRKRGTEDPRP